ncbi:MAG TPA: hypothetical protein VMZ28_24170 [Kofleriaceae bacterium]|nr:hypothetical protein [Kofleriaceae bacterium]
MAADPRRVEVWVAMADHFLDTETRQDIPLTAWRCVVAGLSVAEARWVWDCEVTPAVGFNLREIAGEWAMWPRDWLVGQIESSRLEQPPREQTKDGVWSAIERCIEALAVLPSPAAREETARDLHALARHWFDFVPPVPDAAQRERLRALAPEPFRRLVAPATYPDEVAGCERRLAALVTGDDRGR